MGGGEVAGVEPFTGGRRLSLPVVGGLAGTAVGGAEVAAATRAGATLGRLAGLLGAHLGHLGDGLLGDLLVLQFGGDQRAVVVDLDEVLGLDAVDALGGDLGLALLQFVGLLLLLLEGDRLLLGGGALLDVGVGDGQTIGKGGVRGGGDHVVLVGSHLGGGQGIANGPGDPQFDRGARGVDGHVLGGADVEGEPLAADGGRAGGGQLGVGVVEVELRQSVVDGAGSGPHGAGLTVDGQLELAAVENADLHAVGDLGVQRRGHHVVLADGDPVLLEHLLHRVLANRDTVGFPVHGKDHIVLVQCHRDGDATGDRQRHTACHCGNNHVFLGHRSLPGLRLSGPYRLGQPSRAPI